MDNPPPSRKSLIIRYTVSITSALLLAVLLSGLVIYSKGFMSEMVMRLVPPSEDLTLIARIPGGAIENHKAQLAKEIPSLNKILSTYTPRQPYLIINTTHNTFQLVSKGAVVREGICSTGSFTILTKGKDKKWVFETPRGVLKVKSKQMNPVWVKPDWAFIEEGLPVPSPRHPSRYDHATLGDYKLELGNGYLIHGTLYKRFLGMAVTHGCIRLGDDDLKEVYQTLQRNSNVYIY